MEAKQKLQGKSKNNYSVVMVSAGLVVYSFLLAIYSIVVWYIKLWIYKYRYFYEYGLNNSLETNTNRLYLYIAVSAFGFYFKEKNLKKIASVFIILSILFTIAQLVENFIILLPLIIRTKKYLDYLDFIRIILTLLDFLTLIGLIYMKSIYSTKSSSSKDQFS